jgi:mannose-6-phosphate isomerase
MRRAALDGSIERLLTWHPVRAGDFFYIPAGTVHAIGAGVSLIEVQQNSDVTYRLFDYGRPRELHLEEGLKVAKGEPYADDLHRNLPDDADSTLVDGPLFRLDQVCGPPSAAIGSAYGERPLLVIPRSGTVRIGEVEAAPGECALCASLGELEAGADSRYLIAAPLA